MRIRLIKGSLSGHKKRAERKGEEKGKKQNRREEKG